MPFQNPPKRRLERASFEFISGPYPMYEITYFLKWTLPALLYQMVARTVGDEKLKKNAKLLGNAPTVYLYGFGFIHSLLMHQYSSDRQTFDEVYRNFPPFHRKCLDICCR